jgi:hypothetical protein
MFANLEDYLEEIRYSESAAYDRYDGQAVDAEWEAYYDDTASGFEGSFTDWRKSLEIVVPVVPVVVDDSDIPF